MAYKKFKLAFTLAETLITLAIIGVVAAITIPSLIQNWQNEALENHFKKTFSEFSNATNELVQENGGSLSGIFVDATDMMKAYGEKLKYTKTCASNQDAGVCWHNNTAGWKMLDGRDGWFNANPMPRAITSNGAMIGFAVSTCSPVCGYLQVDINGFKGPNTMGRDLFEMRLYSNKLSSGSSTIDFSKTCNKNNTTYAYGGVDCGTKIMMGLHVDD